MTKENTQHILEAVLLCAHEPLAVDQLQKILEPLALSTQQLNDHLHQLQQYWSTRGLCLERVASGWAFRSQSAVQPYISRLFAERPVRDRKSTRLNSSHVAISYAVICLKQKKNMKQIY